MCPGGCRTSRGPGEISACSRVGGLPWRWIRRDGLSDHAISIWNLNDYSKFLAIPGPAGTISSITFSPDGRFLAVGVSDAALHLWEWRSGTELGELVRHGGGVNDVQFSPDQKMIFSAADDGVVASYPCTICESMDVIVADAHKRIEDQ